jgi:lactate permease
MTIPYTLVAVFLGPEFPSIVGALTGLSIVIPAARRGWLLPKTDSPWEFPGAETWPRDWSGLISTPVDNPADGTAGQHSDRGGASTVRVVTHVRPGVLTAWSPYALVAVLLVLTRLKSLPLFAMLKSVRLSFDGILGTDISHSVEPLYLPGTVFVLVSVVSAWLFQVRVPHFAQVLRQSGRTIVTASTALIFTVPMVQVFINSRGGTAGYVEMPLALAAGVEAVAGRLWPLFATFVGGLGAAVAGSNTVSNMMLALFQFDVGLRLQVDPLWIVALQAVGGAAGNTICVHNVVAASAVVGLTGNEGAVIRRTLPFFCWYALFAGALGYAVVWWSGAGPVNLGSAVLVLMVVGLVMTVGFSRADS